MQKNKIIWPLLLLFLLQAEQGHAQDLLLFDNHKIYYNIVAAHGTQKEKDAAKKLQNILDKQSGKQWTIAQISTTGQKPQIIISSLVPSATSEERCDIFVQNNDVHISASEELLSTAVSFFLETFTNCRQYTAEVLFTPALSTCSIPKNYQHSYIPAFKKRLLYDRSAFEASFINWHGLSNVAGPLSNNKSLGWGLWVHTLFDLVPPATYFDSHPEYFSLRNGKRVPEQLCLSNKKVAELAINQLTLLMKQQPEVQYWSVSQMDNQEYCECNNCKAIAAYEQSQSGPIIKFVNAIAIKFPDKIISTLAYQYSTKPPAHARPLNNVAVVLCAYEADRSVPLNDRRQKDNFSSDLAQWLKVCNNIMVWDYTINLNAIPAPYPNLHVLQPNLQYLRQSGVQMMFLQGWPFNGGGLQEYRAYLLAKLLWDPSLNVEELKQDFFNNYYGKAGPSLISLVNLMQQNFEQSGKKLSIYENLAEHVDGFLSLQNRNRYRQLVNEALSKVENEADIWKRVDAFAQAFRFADIESDWFAVSKKEWVNSQSVDRRIAWKRSKDSLLTVFAGKAAIYGPPTVRENMVTVPEWKSTRSQQFKVGAEVNKALQAEISFKTPYVPDFAGSGPKALIDGAFGTDDWSRTWQGWASTNLEATLKFSSPVSFSSFQMRFMKDPPYSLQPPSSVTVLVSNDGVRFTKLFEVKKQVANDAKKEVVSFENKLSKAITAQCVQVIANWRGRDAEGKGSYLFSDEIFIK